MSIQKDTEKDDNKKSDGLAKIVIVQSNLETQDQKLQTPNPSKKLYKNQQESQTHLKETNDREIEQDHKS